jgi:hypothetical protein
MIVAMDVSTENAAAVFDICLTLVVCVALLCMTYLIAKDKWPFDWPRRDSK